jgi:hypothetical protein
MISTSRIIHINSQDRISGTNENFTYSYEQTQQESYTHCVVLGASIPVSYYLVQDGYNTFDLKENTTTVTITVPAGNYNTNSFANVVSQLMTANSPLGYTYAITMNNSFTNVNTGLFTYTVTGHSFQPQLIFTTNLYEQFGFDENTTVSFVAGTLTSINVCNFVPESTIYIYSDIVKTNSNNGRGVLQELFPSNVIPYGTITYQCTAVDAYSKEINISKTNAFTIVIKNENDQVMNLNGRNMLISLLLYKKDDIFNVAKQYIKYNLTN